jgi:hypothetical protein
MGDKITGLSIGWEKAQSLLTFGTGYQPQAGGLDNEPFPETGSAKAKMDSHRNRRQGQDDKKTKGGETKRRNHVMGLRFSLQWPAGSREATPIPPHVAFNAQRWVSEACLCGSGPDATPPRSESCR